MQVVQKQLETIGCGLSRIARPWVVIGASLLVMAGTGFSLSREIGAAQESSGGPPASQVVSKQRLAWHNSFARAQAESQRLGLPLLVHFHASWCGPCRRMERDVLDTVQLARLMHGRVVAVKVDTDREPRVTARFRVRLLPTDLLVSPTGATLARTQGYQGFRSYQGTMLPAVTRYLAAHPPKKPAAVPSDKRDSGQAKNKTATGAGQVRGGPAVPRIGLAGFSPVTLRQQTRWEKGQPRFSCRVGDVVYHLASARQRTLFQQNPAKYAPRFQGRDVVLSTEAGKIILGSVQHAVMYDGGLYLFAHAKSLARFRQSPAKHVTAANRMTGRQPVATRSK